MNRRTLLTFAALIPLSACGQRQDWRQKLTVIVDTPDGEVSGSAVVGVTAVHYKRPLPLTQTGMTYEITGEATVVEVLPGQYLFALLGGSETRFLEAARNRFEGMSPDEWLAAIAAQTEPVNLLPGHLPMLVTFDDITKPDTVREVNPADLAAIFGPGVRLRAATLEVTEEAVTEGRVEGVLRWLGPYPEPALGPPTGGTTNIPFYRLVHMGDFIRRQQ